MSPVLRLAALAAALPLAACGSLSPARMAATPTHFASHQLCSATFVAGLDPKDYWREVVRPQVSPVGPLLRYRIDRDRGEVTTRLAGGAVVSRAVYRGPLGCIVDQGRPAPAPVVLPAPTPPLLPPIAGPEVVAPADPALAAALDHAFEETARAPHRWTKAVVIVRDGKVIAERYAPGYGVETPIHGWSMTKSVTNALIGVLVRQGRLDMNAPAPVAAWADPKDPRHAVTPDSLLRMASGLKFGQSVQADWTQLFDPTAQMVFASPDMAALPERAPVAAPPGQVFRYSNGNTLLLSRIVRDAAGGSPQATVDFLHRELFDKLGLEHPVLELDAAGTPIGASHMWATARDWARFGLLYLDDGVVGGQRILPRGWVDYSARPTPGGEYIGYGAGFWTNRGDGHGARVRRDGGMPADSFMARGAHGQFTVIVPSKRLVIVKLGYDNTGPGEIVTMNRLVRETVAATGRP